MEVGKSRFSTEVGDTYIRILYDGREAVYFDINEWREDPELVLNIAYAIRMAYERPDLFANFVTNELDRLWPLPKEEEE